MDFTLVSQLSFVLVIANILACHMVPNFMTRLMSQPYANQIMWNIGPNALEFQVVLYAVYHRTCLGVLTHFTIAIDLVSWLVVTADRVNIETMIFTVALLCGQVLTFRDMSLAIATIPLYAVSSVAAYRFLALPHASWYAQSAICVCALIRTIGHLTEGFPPYMMGNKSGWPNTLRYSLTLKPLTVIFSVFVGYISELTAGVPGRLFPILVHFVMIQNGVRRQAIQVTGSVPLHTMEDINNVGQKILGNRLWRAYGPTARLFATEIQSDNNTELTALAPCKVVDIKDEQLNLDAADAMDTTCNSVKADKQAVSDSLADVPGVWLKLFSFEIPIVLFTCGYWICAPSHYLQAMFNVTESPVSYVLIFQGASVVFCAYAWFYSAMLKSPRYTSLYTFCDLQEAMAVGDVAMVLLGLHVNRIFATNSISTVTIYAQVFMASFWLIVRLVFLTYHDARTAKPRANL